MQFPVAFAYRLQVRAVVVVEKLVGCNFLFALKNGKDVFSVDLSIIGLLHLGKVTDQRQKIHAGKRDI